MVYQDNLAMVDDDLNWLWTTESALWTTDDEEGEEPIPMVEPASIVMRARLHQWLRCLLVQQCWLAGYRLRAHLFTMSLTYATTNILCAATDVGMHGLLAIVNHVTILCYPLVCVHCGPVVDFFITKQTSLHPFDFVRNLFNLLVCVLFS